MAKKHMGGVIIALIFVTICIVIYIFTKVIPQVDMKITYLGESNGSDYLLEKLGYKYAFINIDNWHEEGLEYLIKDYENIDKDKYELAFSINREIKSIGYNKLNGRREWKNGPYHAEAQFGNEVESKIFFYLVEKSKYSKDEVWFFEIVRN